MNGMSLANRIKELRSERACSQAQLAANASLSIRTIQRVEMSGKCSFECIYSQSISFYFSKNIFRGLSLAFLINFITMFSFNISMKDGRIHSSFSLTPKAVNLMVAIFSLIFIGTLPVYAIGENLMIRYH